MVQEECAELIAAISHYKRDRIGGNTLAREVADVRIMIEQAMIIIGATTMENAINESLSKLEARLEA
jgi:NTP pyrophosphatase (non-canonical NTP hydrolase)